MRFPLANWEGHVFQATFLLFNQICSVLQNIFILKERDSFKGTSHVYRNVTYAEHQ